MNERNNLPLVPFRERLLAFKSPQSFLEGFIKGFTLSGMAATLCWNMFTELSPRKCLLFSLAFACFGGAWGLRNQPHGKRLEFFERVATPLLPQTEEEGVAKGLILGVILFITLLLKVKKFPAESTALATLGGVTCLGAHLGYLNERQHGRRP